MTNELMKPSLPAVRRQRSALLRLVRRGELSIADAEREAALAGRDHLRDRLRQDAITFPTAERLKAKYDLPSLLKTASDLDPMLEPWWDIYMTLAWIIWRTRDGVARHWGTWRSKQEIGCSHHANEGWEFDTLPPTSLIEIHCDSRKHRQAMTLSVALEALQLRLLEDGHAAISGVVDQRRREHVTMERLADAWLGSHAWPSEVDGDVPLGPYSHILIRRTWVVKQWRAVQERQRRTISAETECTRKLAELMRSEPRASMPKVQYAQQYMREISGLSRAAFNRAWNKAQVATGSTWSRPGRPKKSSGANRRPK